MTLFWADSAGEQPALESQERFWDDWNRTWRFGGLDTFMQAQRSVAFELAERIGLRDGRILDVGCGTGWLGSALRPFGQVWAMDLSFVATSEGWRRHPDVQFICGDFLALEAPSRFDFIVSADSINNMYDPAAFVDRVARALRSGGTFLLMTPNRTVWEHRSALKPLGRGQVQQWPERLDYLQMLEPYFDVEQIRTVDPGGDRGWLWWVENRYVRGAMGRVVGRQRWRALLESAQLGRELIFVARRH